MIVVKGDFGRLEALIARARNIASPAFRQAALSNLAEAARTEIVLGFERGADPHDSRWAPLKVRHGRRVGGQPLRDTGRLQNSFNVRTSATGIVIRSNVTYAGYHQYGTRRMVARPMVPSGQDLGPRWRRSFTRVLDHQIANVMKGR